MTGARADRAARVDARLAAIERRARERSLDGKRAPIRVFGAVFAVPALVATVALPAYGFAAGDGWPAASRFAAAEAQDVDVSARVTDRAISADGYAVVTSAEIEQARLDAEAAERAELAARGGVGAYALVTVQAEGDDYPWWDQTPDDYGGGLSPLGYYFRECVDFAAWRLNRDAGATGEPWRFSWSSSGAGSAYSWADAWAGNGWPTSSEPVVGSIAWFPYNHVAYVQSVPGDGTVVIEEYNQNSDHSYHVRTIPAGEALYLYPPG
ncbi:CHAP domain-containing protein [Agromyces archimandritae]|uniref:CHAP domain-containing protein n=1 Tax=Agromyces archimandritae TaxID=2781962 RepID=A0A975FK43_9MICO|nr:CHAP domain-containing protein [Agromyces archimandritae]QTX04008.1 CHAP domain-containing protein [Agromyces archimandritae]